MCFNIILFKYTGPSLQNCCSSNIFCSKTFLYLSLLIHFQTNYCILNLADAKHVQEISPDFLILYYLRCLICCAVDSQSLPSCSTICRCVFFCFLFWWMSAHLYFWESLYPVKSQICCQISFFSGLLLPCPNFFLKDIAAIKFKTLKYIFMK